MQKKVLITENVFRVLDKEARKKGLTTDELTEILIRREFKIKN